MNGRLTINGVDKIMRVRTSTPNGEPFFFTDIKFDEDNYEFQMEFNQSDYVLFISRLNDDMNSELYSCRLYDYHSGRNVWNESLFMKSFDDCDSFYTYIKDVLMHMEYRDN